MSAAGKVFSSFYTFTAHYGRLERREEQKVQYHTVNVNVRVRRAERTAQRCPHKSVSQRVCVCVCVKVLLLIAQCVSKFLKVRNILSSSHF